MLYLEKENLLDYLMIDGEKKEFILEIMKQEDFEAELYELFNLFKIESEKFLNGKRLTAYRDFLNGSLNFSDENQRQNLSRARKIIKEKSPNLPC